MDKIVVADDAQNHPELRKFVQFYELLKSVEDIYELCEFCSSMTDIDSALPHDKKSWLQFTYMLSLVRLTPRDLAAALLYEGDDELKAVGEEIERLDSAQARNRIAQSLRDEQSPGPDPLIFMPLRMRDLERHAIEAALIHTQGDRAKAARILGIGRKTLYRKLSEYGIDAPTSREFRLRKLKIAAEINIDSDSVN